MKETAYLPQQNNFIKAKSKEISGDENQKGQLKITDELRERFEYSLKKYHVLLTDLSIACDRLSPIGMNEANDGPENIKKESPYRFLPFIEDSLIQLNKLNSRLDELVNYFYGVL
jgi:hypothetical protein